MSRYDEYLFKLKSFPKDFGEVGFMKVKDISIPSISEHIINSKNDPFVNAVKWEEFKEDLLNRGTFWHAVINTGEPINNGDEFKEPDGKWWLCEGFHRIKAYNEMIDDDILPKDFKVLVIRFKTNQHNDIRSNYYANLMNDVNAYRFLSVSQLIPHPEINKCSLYWNELE